MFISRAISRHWRVVSMSKPCLTSNVINSLGPVRFIRPIATTAKLFQEDKLSGGGGVSEHGKGRYSRTDDHGKVTHPEEHTAAGAGRSGSHLKRTLASFSLEGRVAVVTGGARGLGLVMAQALVISGADVALVDLDSK